jgi:hypothetical protein
MTQLLFVLVFANLAYLIYAYTKKQKQVKKSFSEEIKFLDMPDNLNVADVYPKMIKLSESQGKNGASEWWDAKIDSPSASSRSRRVRKIEHDQYLLSDLDF